MIKIHNGSAVPRYHVFVLDDGAYVVQWTEASVQDLLSGAYRDYQPRAFGHRITDYELEQLKTSSVIEDFDQAYVWVYALPEDNRFGALHTLKETSSRARSYYINTTISAEKLDELQACIHDLDLAGQFCACDHEGLVAVLAKDAIPFSSLKDAENAQRKLHAQVPAFFENAAVAFTEGSRDSGQLGDEEEQIDLDALIASQTDTSVTRGRVAVVACKDDDERRAILQLCASMEMSVSGVQTAHEVLHLLEEKPVDVLIMDARFEDMHGWAMLGKAHEISHAERTHVIVLADADADDQVFALTVAKVDVYLRKPISMARLRQSVWSALKDHAPS